MAHKLDTNKEVFFYEQEFYVLSNFSAFTLQWDVHRFDTSEAAYHWEKFNYDATDSVLPYLLTAIRGVILTAPSAHEAFKIAEKNRHYIRPDWSEVRVGIMKEIFRAKAAQHEYVRRKLLATGDRVLIEDSWRDSFWGWGPDQNGENMLGKLWMEVRTELQVAEFHAQAARHVPTCEWHEHYTSHIDENTGDEFDCLYNKCGCNVD